MAVIPDARLPTRGAGHVPEPKRLSGQRRVLELLLLDPQSTQVPGSRAKNLARPDEILPFPFGRNEVVTLGDLTVGRSTIEPGWRWSQHIKPMVGTTSCQARHVGVVLSGRAHIRMDDGTELEIGPDDVYDIAPGHDGWVVGTEPIIQIEWSGLRSWNIWSEGMRGERILTTVLFTDIVGSTEIARRLGDSAWRDLLADHYERAREQLSRFRGREVKTTGDGQLAIFDAPARAVQCADAIRRTALDSGLEIRAGINTGEVELVADDVRGLTVHEAARVLAAARPGEILVTKVTRELIGSGVDFEERGVFELKGISEPRDLFAVRAMADRR